MSNRLPAASGWEAVRAFEKAGWTVARQRGSHIIMVKPGVPVNLSIPDHRTLGRGLLRKLIRLSGLTVKEFLDLLKDP